MMEKALMIIIFMYVASYSVLGAQYILGDVLGVTLTSYDGVVLESHIISFVDEAFINQQTENIVSANYTSNSTFYDKVETSTTAAAYIGWELALLLSGTYIFNFMYLMGIPLYFVVIFVVVYVILMARAIIGYIRGV
jgi:uncharacterized protein YacL